MQALNSEVRKAMDGHDVTRLWLLKRHAGRKTDEVAYLMPARMGGGGGEPPDVRDPRAVLSEADKLLVDPKVSLLASQYFACYATAVWLL